MLYNVTSLLEAVKDRASWPDSTTTYTDAKLLTWLDDETVSFLVPEIIRRQQDYLVKYKETTLTVATDRYRLPARAFGDKVLRVGVIQTDGKYRPLDRMDAVTALEGDTDGQPDRFFLEGQELVLYPNPTVAETLRVYHYRRPSRLVVSTDAPTVTARTSTTITLSSAPSGFPTTAQDYDIVCGTGPHDWRAIDASATRSSTTLTFSSFNPVTAGVAVGDYVTLAGYTFIPNIPYDLVPILAQLGANRFFESIGDFDALAAGMKRLTLMANQAGISLGNRADDAPERPTAGAFALDSSNRATQIS